MGKIGVIITVGLVAIGLSNWIYRGSKDINKGIDTPYSYTYRWVWNTFQPDSSKMYNEYTYQKVLTRNGELYKQKLQEEISDLAQKEAVKREWEREQNAHKAAIDTLDQKLHKF